MDDHQTEHLVRVPIEQIRPSTRNPREKLVAIDELAESIRSYGLLQPIVLRTLGDSAFEVVAGHRRLAAITLLGWADVPASIREVPTDQAYLMTLVENLQRDDLTPKEQSRALEVLVRERSWTTRQVAEAVKRSPSFVSKRLRVFEDPILSALVLSNRLSVSTAEELLPVPMPRKRVLAERAAAERWEPHQVRAAVAGRIGGKRQSGRVGLTSHVRELRSMIREIGIRDLTETQRNELRLLFKDLSLLAKAPLQAGIVIPALPINGAGRGH